MLNFDRYDEYYNVQKCVDRCFDLYTPYNMVVHPLVFTNQQVSGMNSRVSSQRCHTIVDVNVSI